MKDGFYWARLRTTVPAMQEWTIAKVTDGHIYWPGIAGASKVNDKGRVSTYSLGQDRQSHYDLIGPLDRPGLL